MRSLLDEVETDQARLEPDEIMDINLDSESNFEINEEHETFELKGKFSNATLKNPSRKIGNHKRTRRHAYPCQKDKQKKVHHAICRSSKDNKAIIT
ncbi:hypothetical protein TNCV_1799491 [Trichonephila clavipes]|nr:hypothetical protein TNCV_1799491 [Trichonephila clavipes]